MQGIGRVAELPVAWRESLPDAWFWDGDAFELLDPPRTRLSTREGEFVPAEGFARVLRAAGRTAPPARTARRRPRRSAAPDAMPGMWMVPTEGMPLLADTVHYDAVGQQRLGLAFAAAMVGLQHR